jgi:hypothetical protein
MSRGYKSPSVSHVLNVLDDLMQDLTDLGHEKAADALNKFYCELEWAEHLTYFAKDELK